MFYFIQQDSKSLKGFYWIILDFSTERWSSPPFPPPKSVELNRNETQRNTRLMLNILWTKDGYRLWSEEQTCELKADNHPQDPESLSREGSSEAVTLGGIQNWKQEIHTGIRRQIEGSAPGQLATFCQALNLPAALGSVGRQSG